MEQQQLWVEPVGSIIVARLGAMSLRTAILVPNTRIAYLWRIAFGQFGEEHYRVVFNDLVRALKPSPSFSTGHPHLR